MPFPQSPRVVYRVNPLEEVVCQVRFSPILRIDAEPPAAFQEQIRQEFPAYQAAASVAPQGIPVALAPLFAVVRSPHFFSTADEVWKASLANEFLAITTIRYTRWEDFRAHFERVLHALLSIYNPPYFTRIGLRYRNIIRRSALRIGEIPWHRLLRSYVAGELASEGDVPHAISEALRQLVVSLPNDHRVRIVHGLVPPEEGSDEVTYQIDSDFFSEVRTETSNVLQVLDGFHRQAGQLFRWCISDELHDALDPTPVVDFSTTG